MKRGEIRLADLNDAKGHEQKERTDRDCKNNCGERPESCGISR